MNNGQIRANNVVENFEKRLTNLRAMSEEELKEFEDEIKKQSAIVKERVDLVSILSGRQIGEKAFEHLKEAGMEEFNEAVEDGNTFAPDQVPYFDQKTKKVAMRTVYYSPEPVMCTQATEKIASAEEIDQIKRRLNKYEIRRLHGKGKQDSLNAVMKAIKVVRKERVEAEMEAKKVKLIPLAILGKKLMASLPVQKVEPEIKA